MFTYPVFGGGGGGGLATEEWLVTTTFTDPYGNQRIIYYHNSGSSIDYIAHTARPGGQSYLCSDGEFVITPGTTYQHVSFLKWNGGTGFTSVKNLYGGGDNLQKAMLSEKNMAGRFIVLSTATRSSSVYAHGASSMTQYEVATGEWVNNGILDFRRGEEVGMPMYGTLYLFGTAGLNSERSQLATVSGNTLTIEHSIVTDNTGVYGSFQYTGWDRDHHFVVGLPSAPSTSFSLWEIDVDTPLHGARQTSSTLPGGRSSVCVTASKGFVISGENDGKLHSYSKSGTTLTEVDSITCTGLGNNSQLVTSPYTGYVYHAPAASGSSVKCVAVADDGSLTAIPWSDNLYNASGGLSGNWAFLDAPLPS